MTDPDAYVAERLAAIPYARFLGMRLTFDEGRLIAHLPYAERLIGNPVLPALHGGVIGAFMEMTALIELTRVETASGAVVKRQPKPIGVTVEYLRTGRPTDTYAHALITRMGRRVANVRVEAWQGDRAAPIAGLHGHFLLQASEAAL